MADNFATTMVKADVDAKSLSDFMSKPSSALVPRRLSDPVNTLDYFLDYLQGLEKVYTQQTGLVNVNGVQVKAITQAVIDALNSAAIDNNTQVDTLITSTPQYVGAIARTLADVNSDIVNAKTFGANSNADSEGIKKAIDYAVLSGNKVVFNFDATIKIPSHAANISDAIHSVASIGNRKFTVLIESGHRLTKGVYVEDGNYSNFTISSTDAEVSVATTYTDAYIIKAERAHAPVLNTVVNGIGIVDTMIDIQHNSVVSIKPYKGVRNPSNRGVYLNGSSRGYMNYLISTGATVAEFGRNLWVSRNSDCECGGAELDGAGDYNLWVSRGSNVYGESIKFRNSNFGAIGATRFSVAACNLATITNCGAVARCFAGQIYLNDSKATGIKTGGIYNEEGGVVAARNIEITADSTSATLEYGIKCDSGATVSAVSSKIIGFKLSSVYASGGATVNVDTSTLTGVGTGIILDARDAGTISAKTCIMSGAAIGVNARNLSKVIISFSTMSSVTTNSVYALNGSTVDITSANLNTIASNNIATYRGSTVIAQSTKVNAVAIATTDTNSAAFNTWTANGAVFA